MEAVAWAMRWKMGTSELLGQRTDHEKMTDLASTNPRLSLLGGNREGFLLLFLIYIVMR
jgi:hypothetical protein